MVRLKNSCLLILVALKLVLKKRRLLILILAGGRGGRSTVVQPRKRAGPEQARSGRPGGLVRTSELAKREVQASTVVLPAWLRLLLVLLQ